MIEIREELLHTISSHFPIALLSLALITKSLQLIFMRLSHSITKQLQTISTFLLYTGLVFYIIALFLGDTAFDIIKSSVCNLTLIYKHEQMAENAIPYFIIAIFFEIAVAAKIKLFKKHSLVVRILTLLALSIGNYYMFSAAHIGGTMVYEQGVAVKNYKCLK
jgi:uncharacterized membrane protein